MPAHHASGHEGDAALAGFAVRKAEFAIYIVAGFEGHEDLLAKLGRHKTADLAGNRYEAEFDYWKK